MITIEYKVSLIIEDYSVLVGVGRIFCDARGQESAEGLSHNFPVDLDLVFVGEGLFAILVDNSIVWTNWVEGIIADSIGLQFPALFHLGMKWNRKQL
jgi:hypothetical protein